jgi:hypothetical protein
VGDAGRRLPWFMTVFGRDSLMTAYETMPFHQELAQATLQALAWLEGPADLDGDGYLEYRKRSDSDKALDNHCWKDSDNSIRFADGRKAEPPIATCELQGYAYDARLRTARLMSAIWRDEDTAARLERDAAELKRRFNRDFWIPRRRHYALALDGDKNQVDAMTSNNGHLLWSGIVDEGRAKTIVRRLTRGDMFSGWACGRCPRATPASTRSSTTTELSGRTTRRLVPPACGAKGSATRRGSSARRSSRRRPRSAISCRRSSPASSATRQASRSSIRMRSSRSRGPRPHRCSRCDRCSVSTSSTDACTRGRMFRRNSEECACETSAHAARISIPDGGACHHVDRLTFLRFPAAPSAARSMSGA